MSPCAETALTIMGVLSFCPTELQVPLVLMHTRGLPDTMNSLAEYKTDVVEEVCSELDEQLQKAADAGIPRWNQIVDPGIGFAKSGEQNLVLLGNLNRIHQRFNGRQDHNPVHFSGP